MYQVGEYVMYRNVGVCIVEAIGKLGFSAEKEKEYYTLRPLYTSNHSRFYVPVYSDVFIRNVITEQEAQRYLNELEYMQTKPYCAAKPAKLAAYYDSLYIKHSLADHLRLFKELCQKEKKIREQGKKFGQLESNYKNQIEKLLADEFSCAFHETPEVSKKRLYKVV